MYMHRIYSDNYFLRNASHIMHAHSNPQIMVMAEMSTFGIFLWQKCPCSKCPGRNVPDRNVHGQNVLHSTRQSFSERNGSIHWYSTEKGYFSFRSNVHIFAAQTSVFSRSFVLSIRSNVLFRFSGDEAHM